MNRIDKNNYYLDLANSALERSTCLRRKWGEKMMKLSLQATMVHQGEEKIVVT